FMARVLTSRWRAAKGRRAIPGAASFGRGNPSPALALINACGVGRGPILVDYSRPDRDAPGSLTISDSPPRDADALWAPLAHIATFGIFLILFIALLYLGRTVLLPVFAAGIVALTLAPLVKAARRRGVSPWIMAVLIVVLGIAALGLALTAMAG